MSDEMTPDEVRGLLDQYAEGMLDDATMRALEAALARDPDLAAEAEAMKATLGVLRALPRPPAPDDMLARVRAQLAAEKAEALSVADAEHAAHQHDAEAALRGPTIAPVVPLPRRGLWMEAAIAVAAAAALIVGVIVAGPPSGGHEASDGIGAAGIATVEHHSSLVVTGVSAERVWALAADHGLSADTPDGLVFTGTGAAAAHFHLALMREAAEHGGEVEGLVGQGDMVELRLSLRPLVP
jgi:negative regulator of sigma E activity